MLKHTITFGNASCLFRARPIIRVLVRQIRPRRRESLPGSKSMLELLTGLEVPEESDLGANEHER